MEHKKNPNLVLKQYQKLFFNVGLIISLLMVTTAFEWRFYNESLPVFDPLPLAIDTLIAIPQPNTEPPPPPKKESNTIIEVNKENDNKEKDSLPPVFVDTLAIIDTNNLIDTTFLLSDDVDTTAFVWGAEIQAAPFGGYDKFYAYVAREMGRKVSKSIKERCSSSKIFLGFMVSKTGKLSQFKVKSNCPAIEKIAIDVVKAYGKWEPAKQRYRPVKQQMALPIILKLN